MSSLLENLCLNSSKSFLSFFNFLLLTFISIFVSGSGYVSSFSFVSNFSFSFVSGFNFVSVVGVCFGFGFGFVSGFGTLSVFFKWSLDFFHNRLYFYFVLLVLARIMIDFPFLYPTKVKIFYIITISFYNNLGICAMFIYFCFVLIGLINGYKKFLFP